MSLSEPVIKEVSPLRVVSIREKGVYDEAIPKNIKLLCAVLFSPDSQRAGVKITGPRMTIYHDGEYKEKDADIEVAMPVTGRVAVPDSLIEVRNLPGGRFLSIIYKGPYPEIHEAWCRVYSHAEEHGISLSVPGRELYLNDPDQVPDEELLTEIQIPVAGESET